MSVKSGELQTAKRLARECERRGIMKKPPKVFILVRFGFRGVEVHRSLRVPVQAHGVIWLLERGSEIMPL